MHVTKRISLNDLESEEKPIAKSNPDMIKHARKMRGLSDEDLERFIENYKGWEEGTIPTTWDDLRLIAKIYARPSFYYFLKEPPSLDESDKNYPILSYIEDMEKEFKSFKKEIINRLDIIKDNVDWEDL